ncbi:MAG: transcription antitermination factor NusB [Alicyclobacillaceae bacterium]|nr:transcription antitermination factor NusB [Alicyclobacillaceae bacterium]
MRRRAAREKALQALFAVDLGGLRPEEALARVLEADPDEEEGPRPDAEFAEQLVLGTAACRERVDAVLKAYSTGWELGRMASVDRNILRLSVYELMYRPETPVSVVMNEAVELAKKFSTEESGRFVNGVLARIIPHLEELRAGVAE